MSLYNPLSIDPNTPQLAQPMPYVAPPTIQLAEAGSIDPSVLFGENKALGWGDIQNNILLGNMKQESEFRPGVVNPKEGAQGLLQFRDSRLDDLKAYALATNSDCTDHSTQLKFIRQEMGFGDPKLPAFGTEAKAGKAFAEAKDMDSANKALKEYIRYGDDSEGTRLANASHYAGVAINRQASTRHQAVQPGETPGGSPPAPAVASNPAFGRKQLMSMMLAASLANVRLQPVDYDPFALMPKF